jgi:hypothetical protein
VVAIPVGFVFASQRSSTGTITDFCIQPDNSTVTAINFIKNLTILAYYLKKVSGIGNFMPNTQNLIFDILN